MSLVASNKISKRTRSLVSNSERGFMLSNNYRQRLSFICSKIKNGEEVQLRHDLGRQVGKANRSAYEMLRQARRESRNPNADGLDKFLNEMNLGDPDPSNHKSSFHI